MQSHDDPLIGEKAHWKTTNVQKTGAQTHYLFLPRLTACKRHVLRPHAVTLYSVRGNVNGIAFMQELQTGKIHCVITFSARKRSPARCPTDRSQANTQQVCTKIIDESKEKKSF
uniref:Uncharacterized protein n=1 Tax=Lotharella oceanica TaxID=641309 RepID=A0A7S2TWF8_9EUKA|mmetsp:Transcript_312/g.572  ORF Transcript_312/g.572 Transcript_312/m.572 type:complete len:114 (+) Transcript_312:94-435(+)